MSTHHKPIIITDEGTYYSDDCDTISYEVILEEGDTIKELIVLSDTTLLDSLLRLNITVENLTIFGNNGSALTEIPAGLMVDRGYIKAEYTSINKVPDNLNLRMLDLSHSKIHTLPKNLSCDMLYIDDTNITHIPDSTRVANILSISNIVSHVPDTIEAKAIYISTGDKSVGATRIPVRAYHELSISNPDTLVDGITANRLRYHVTDRPLILPPSMTEFEVLTSFSNVVFQPKTVITHVCNIHAGKNQEVKIPNDIIMPASHIVNIRSLDKSVLYDFHDRFNGNPYYRQTDDGVALISQELPDRKIVIADGLIMIYSSKRTIGDITIYKEKNRISCNNTYLAVRGEYAYHSYESVKDAVLELTNKMSANTNMYAHYDIDGKIVITDATTHKLDDVLSLGNCRELYHSVTGSCYVGIDRFIDRLRIVGALKDSYTIRELGTITKGEYGYHEFLDYIERIEDN